MKLPWQSADVDSRFGQYRPDDKFERERLIHAFLRATFPNLLASPARHRLGFDVAASGNGDLAAIYIDEVKGNDLWLQALFTCRTEDWHFLQESPEPNLILRPLIRHIL